MTKQEQIEKLKEIISKEWHGETIACDGCKDSARNLYSAGFRYVDKNDVLSEEEIENRVQQS
jgi:hypothetical protein